MSGGNFYVNYVNVQDQHIIPWLSEAERHESGERNKTELWKQKQMHFWQYPKLDFFL